MKEESISFADFLGRLSKINTTKKPTRQCITIDAQHIINIIDKLPFLQVDLYFLRIEHGVPESSAHLLDNSGSSEATQCCMSQQYTG